LLGFESIFRLVGGVKAIIHPLAPARLRPRAQSVAGWLNIT
jgi:hypothetical protein